jgi:putative ABC transport system permease protein
MLVTVTLGFWALLTSLSLKDSQTHLVRTQSRHLLTGDLQVSAARPLTEAEIDHLNAVYKPVRSSIERELLASLRMPGRASLIELRAVTPEFPIVGAVKIGGGRNGAIRDMAGGTAWIAKELADELKISPGDEVKIGEAGFIVSEIITADVGARRGAVGFAPRVYIPLSDLEATKLIQPGSQIQYKLTLGLPPDLDVQKARSRLENWPEELVIRNPEDAVTGVQRAIEFVERFISLLTLFLALLGFVTGFYLLQIHLRERAGVFALYEVLGARHTSVALAAVAQVLIVLSTGWVAAWIIVLLQIRALNPVVTALLPGGAGLVAGPASVGLSLALLAGNFVMFSLPFVIRLKQMALDQLLNQSLPTLPVVGWRKDIGTAGLALATYLALAAWLLNSFVISGVLIIALAALLLLSGWLLPMLFRFLIGSLRLEGMTRVVALGLSRPRLLLALIWLGLGWSAAIGSAIPNLYELAKSEIHTPSTDELPQLFAININEDDLMPLRNAVAAAGGELRHASPLLLARVISHNGKPPEKDHLARRPVRLTYRAGLTDAEKLVAGPALPAKQNPGEPLGISVEANYAERQGLALGDNLEFEISGVRMTARIQNLRQVKWSTFQPNFFLQFPTGVLEDFPKSFLAVVYGLNFDSLFSTQAALADQFPSISLLNLATTLDRLKELTDKLGFPILGITGIALAVTALLLALLVWHQWRERAPERLLLSWIGANDSWLKRAAWRETLFWSGSALIFGLLLGNVMSMAVSVLFFESWAAPNFWMQAIVSLAGVTLTAWPNWRPVSR